MLKIINIISLKPLKCIDDAAQMFLIENALTENRENAKCIAYQNEIDDYDFDGVPIVLEAFHVQWDKARGNQT